MILGAGIYQVPLIRKASEMGLFTIVVSIPGPYPGFALADRPYEINTTDAEAVLEAARAEQIDGIVTTGTDVAVRTVGRVCAALGLPGIPEEAARVVTDKARMKEAFSGIVSSSPFRVLQLSADLTEDVSRRAAEAASELGYPVMVKAVDVSGSRGVTRVDSPAEIGSAVRAAVSATHTDRIVVEGFARGEEIGLDAFVENGQIRAFFPHRKFVRRAGCVTIPGGHAFPYRCTDALRENLLRETEAIVRATGIDNCALNCDIMIDGENVSVIEAGGRCGATCIPELIERHTGIDYYGQMIRNALGEPCDFTQKKEQPCGAKLLFSDRDGIIDAIDRAGIRVIRERTGAEIVLDYEEGRRVEAVKNGTSRIGHVIADTDSEEELDRIAAEVLGCIKISG